MVDDEDITDECGAKGCLKESDNPDVDDMDGLEEGFDFFNEEEEPGDISNTEQDIYVDDDIDLSDAKADDNAIDNSDDGTDILESFNLF